MKTIKPYRRRRSKKDEVNTAYATCSTCQGYLHVIDKVLFYDDAGGSDGALGKAVGFSAGAVALGAAFL